MPNIPLYTAAGPMRLLHSLVPRFMFVGLVSSFDQMVRLSCWLLDAHPACSHDAESSEPFEPGVTTSVL